MPNSFFRFKQFTVHQDKSAMKVCTDSCLFGAWAARYINENDSISYLLDMGAGTGLLSLMLAQSEGNTFIDAVELDTASAQQARDNFEHSPWKEKLALHESRVQDFYPTRLYDFIISNPPFFENDLLSGSEAKNIAHHHAELNLQELVEVVKRLLSDKGIFAVLLPYHRTGEFEALMQKAGFFAHHKVKVKQTEHHAYFRSMLLFSRIEKGHEENVIKIKESDGNYTTEFVALLKDYYLYL